MLMQRQMLAGAALVTPQQHGSTTLAEQPLPNRQTQQQQHPDYCCPIRRERRAVQERQAMQQSCDL